YAMMRLNLNQDIQPEITFKDIQLISSNGNSIISETGKAHPDGWKVYFENINVNPIKESEGKLVNTPNAHIEFNGEFNFVSTDKSTMIDGAKTVTVNENAKVSFLTNGLFYTTANIAAQLNIKKGAILNIHTSEVNKETLILMEESYSEINVDGGELKIDSQRDYEGNATISQTKSGLIRFT